MRTVYPLKCQIRAEAGAATRVDVYDDIGEGGWFSEGVSAKDFAASLGKVKGALEVHINSGGGDVFDGIAIGNAIRAHKGPVSTHVDGIAASIASVIAQAGQDRVVAPGSMLMIHDAWGGCVGNAADMAKQADVLDKVSDNIAAIYADKAGGSTAAWRSTMKDETWYTAEEALAAGLADRIAGADATLPPLDLAAAFDSLPGRIAARMKSMPVAAAQTPAEADPDDPTPEQSCADLGHQCCKDAAAMTQDAVLTMIRAEIHAGLHNADVDEGAWDGGEAMSAAAKSENPASAYAAICAGRRAGDPDKQDSWALPHHEHPGAAPNRNGVNNALSRLPQTEGLTNEAAARAHLEAHQKAIGSGTADHAHHDLSGLTPEQIRAALKGATE